MDFFFTKLIKKIILGDNIKSDITENTDKEKLA